MGPVIILQLIILSIHEWVPIIHSRFRSNQVSNTAPDCCPSWVFSCNVHHHFSTNIFVVGRIFNVVLLMALFYHHVPLCFIYWVIVFIPMFHFIGFVHVVDIETGPNIIKKVCVIQPLI